MSKIYEVINIDTNARHWSAAETLTQAAADVAFRQRDTPVGYMEVSLGEPYALLRLRHGGRFEIRLG